VAILVQRLVARVSFSGDVVKRTVVEAVLEETLGAHGAQTWPNQPRSLA